MKRWIVGWADGRMVIRLAALLYAYPPIRPSDLLAQCPDGTPPPCLAAVRPANPAPNSVAVLYFDNLSPDTMDGWLADGLTEELTTRLGQLARLQVKHASRDAVRRLRDTVPDYLVAIGRLLRVRYLVEGGVRTAAGHVRVSVRLVRAADGVQSWTASYDRPLADLLALEQELAEAVSTEIGGRLAPAERATLVHLPTRDPKAYEHFLRGNYSLARRGGPRITRAIAEYQAAVRLDPGFARAYGRIAFAYAAFLQGPYVWPGLPSDTLLARGLAASDTALRLDPNTSDAWLGRATLWIRLYPYTYDGTLPALEKAIRLDSTDAEAFHQYGVVLAHLGRYTDALSAFDRALAIDPERAPTLYWRGQLAFYLRQFAQARSWLDSANALDPLASWQGLRVLTYLALGDTASARGVARLSALNSTRARQTLEALVDAATGDTTGARALLAEILTGVPDTISPGLGEALSLALTFVAVGDRDRAFMVLNRYHPRGILFFFFLRSPTFDPLRSDPRFAQLVEQPLPPGVLGPLGVPQ